jgi:hypothetical protein
MLIHFNCFDVFDYRIFALLASHAYLYVEKVRENFLTLFVFLNCLMWKICIWNLDWTIETFGRTDANSAQNAFANNVKSQLIVSSRLSPMSS